jgi:hypothetical protein
MIARCAAAVLACCVVALDAPAQSDRTVLFVDGRPEELILIRGKSRWIQEPGRVRVGVAALRIEPTAAEKYPGFTISNVPTRGAGALVLGIFLEGDEAKSYRVRIDDDQTSNEKDDFAIEYASLNPGWNDLVVSIADRKTAKGRPMKFPALVRKVQVDKKNERGDPAIVLDAVRVRGAPKPPERRGFVDQLANEKDLSRKVTMLKELDALDDADVASIARDILAREQQPRIRRGAREALARISSPEVALGIADSMKEVPAAERPELLWAVAAMPCAQTRQRAISWVREGKWNAGDRTAILNGLRVAGGSDLRTLIADIPPTAPWPLRAALVHGLRGVAEPESVDALITILAEPGSARVAEDAEAALGQLTGGDYGPDAATWRDWWNVNREKITLNTKPKSKQGSYAKSTFYGVPVPVGRVVFVIDTSGSMAEAVGGGKLADYVKSAPHLSTTGINTRLDLAKAELVHAVQNMKDKAAVGVVSFAAAERWVTKGIETVTQDLRQKIGERVHALGAGRSTNVYAGMFAAFHPEGKPRPQDLLEGPDTIFLLTDGNPSSGKYTDFFDLRDEVLAWNLSRAIRIHCVNVGDADARLLRDLSYGSGGTLVDLRSERKPKEPPK